MEIQDTLLGANGFTSSGGSDWHIQCGQPLVVLHETPTVPASCYPPASLGLWPTAMADETFTDIVVQPHADPTPGVSTLTTDVDAILVWAALQPGARVHLYESVAHEDVFLDLWGSPPVLGSDPDTIQAPTYFDLLFSTLEVTLGPRLIRSAVAEVNYEIALLADGAGFPGLVDSTDLYDDAVPNHPSEMGKAVACIVQATTLAGRTLVVNSGDLSLSGVGQTEVNNIQLITRQVLFGDPRTGVVD